MLSILFATALAQSFTADLDGDGKAEAINVNEGTWTVNNAILCDGSAVECEVALLDIVADDKKKELSVCMIEIRDDRNCEVWTWSAGALKKVAFADGAVHGGLEANGNGFVMVKDWRDIYTRTTKFAYKDGRLTEVAQPFWFVGSDTHIEVSVPIYLAPESTSVVANIKPDTDVTILLESPAKPGWFLLKLSSGLNGWVKLDKLATASQGIAAQLTAG